MGPTVNSDTWSRNSQELICSDIGFNWIYIHVAYSQPFVPQHMSSFSQQSICNKSPWKHLTKPIFYTQLISLRAWGCTSGGNKSFSMFWFKIQITGLENPIQWECRGSTQKVQKIISLKQTYNYQEMRAQSQPQSEVDSHTPWQKTHVKWK